MHSHQVTDNTFKDSGTGVLHANSFAEARDHSPQQARCVVKRRPTGHFPERTRFERHARGDVADKTVATL